MIAYLVIATVLFFIGGVLNVVVRSDDPGDFGFVLLASALWPISLFFIMIFATGEIIKKVFKL